MLPVCQLAFAAGAGFDSLLEDEAVDSLLFFSDFVSDFTGVDVDSEAGVLPFFL